MLLVIISMINGKMELGGDADLMRIYSFASGGGGGAVSKVSISWYENRL